MRYKLINKQTGEEYLCDKVTIDSFDYYYIDELIPHNPNGGTNGNFICLSEIISNKDYGVKLGDKYYVSPFVKNVGQCGGCRKLIATNDPNIDVPKVLIIKECECNLALYPDQEEICKDFCNNKSQETHPFSEEDMIEFGQWVSHNDWVYLPSKNYWVNEEQEELEQKLKSKELLQLWKEQKPKIVYYA